MANLVYSFQILDADGNKTALTMYAKHTSATMAQLQAWGTAMSELIDGILDAKVTKVSLLVDVALGSVKADPSAGSNIQETALVGFDASGTPYNHGIDLPGYIDTGFTGKSVDQLNAGFEAWRDYLITVSNTIIGTDRYGNALLSVAKARKTFRKFRKQSAKA